LGDHKVKRVQPSNNTLYLVRQYIGCICSRKDEADPPFMKFINAHND